MSVVYAKFYLSNILNETRVTTRFVVKLKLLQFCFRRKARGREINKWGTILVFLNICLSHKFFATGIITLVNRKENKFTEADNLGKPNCWRSFKFQMEMWFKNLFAI